MAAVLTTVVFTVSLIGCSEKPKQKTFVIKDQAVKSDNIKFELAKLTKVEGKGTIQGWLNENDMLTTTGTRLQEKDSIGRSLWYELDRLTNNNLQSKKLFEKNITNMVLSPDGTKIAYTVMNGNKYSIGIINTSSGEDEGQLKTAESFDNIGELTWSSNSRYISCYSNKGILVYDSENSQYHIYNDPNLNLKYASGHVLVSDDGKHAIVSPEEAYTITPSQPITITFCKPVVNLEDGSAIQIDAEFNEASSIVPTYSFSGEKVDVYILDLSLTNNLATSKLDIFALSWGIPRFTFLNNDEVLYTGSKGELSALYSYDINSKKNNEIMENVTDFNIAPNNKYIAYVTGSELNIGYLNNNKIENSSLIFKGSIGAFFRWNNDCKKLIFQGHEEKDIGEKQFVAELK